MSKCNNLSVCILALNEARHIEKCLKSVYKWAGEIIVVVDDLTTDETAKIALRYTKKVYKCPHKDNFHINKQFALEKAAKSWVFWLDGDERISGELAAEILSTINPTSPRLHGASNQQSNPRPEFGSKAVNSGFFVPRKNIIFNKWVKYTWHPDYQLRLFKNGKVKFPCKKIHEHPKLTGSVAYLKNPLIHYNYQTVTQFIEKLNRYTSVDARSFVKEFRPPYYKHFITRPIDDFIKRFLAWQGYKDGLHGLVLSLLQAVYQLVVVAKAWELKKFQQKNPEKFIKKTEKEGKKILKSWYWWTKQIQIEESKSLFKKILLKGLRRLGK